jgi:tetratricopeptide (TPR) repeat protein
LHDQVADLIFEIEDALPVAQRTADPAVAQVLQFAYADLGKFALDEPLADRLENLQCAAALADKLQDEGSAFRYRFAQARLCHESSQLAQAVKILRELLNSAAPEQDRPYARAYLAALQRRLGDYAEVTDLLEDLSTDWPQPHKRIAAGVHGTHIQLLIDLGLPDRAWPLLEEEAAFLESSEQPLQNLREAHQILRANLLFTQGDYQGAQRFLEQCLASGEHTFTDSNRGHLQLLLGLVQAQQELTTPNRSEAARSLQEALRFPLPAADRLRVHLAQADLSLRARKVQRASDWLNAAQQQLRDSGGPCFRESCHLARLRARLSLQTSAAPAQLLDCEQELRSQWRILQKAWRRIPLRGGGVGLLRKSSRRAILSELMRLSLRQGGSQDGPRRALEDLLTAQSLGSLSRAMAARPVNLEQLRKMLSPTHGMLLYLTAPHQSHVFAVDSEQLIHEELDLEDRLERLSRRYVSEVLQPPTQTEAAAREASIRRERALAEELASQLLPPSTLSCLESWSSVTLVTLDWMESVPFECLLLPGGQRLGLQLAIDYLPSVPVGLALLERNSPTPRPHDYGLLAAPVSSSSVQARWPRLDSLAFSKSSADLLSQCFPASSWILQGAAATADALLQRRAEVTVLQFLGHGIHLPEEERSFALVMAPDSAHPDGLLRSADVEATHGGPPLVLLTSCHSAGAPLRAGDPFAAEIAAAWFLSGSQTVLHSRAALDYHATLELSRHFLRHIAGGEPPAEALLRARRMLSHQAEFQQPYYHSLLHVVGLGQQPVFQR